MKPFSQLKVSISVALVLLLTVSSTAFAAAQGEPLKLGVVNAINILTFLVGTISSSIFRVVNINTLPNALAVRAQHNG